MKVDGKGISALGILILIGMVLIAVFLGYNFVLPTEEPPAKSNQTTEVKNTTPPTRENETKREENITPAWKDYEYDVKYIEDMKGKDVEYSRGPYTVTLYNSSLENVYLYRVYSEGFQDNYGVYYNREQNRYLVEDQGATYNVSADKVNGTYTLNTESRDYLVFEVSVLEENIG